MYGGFFVRWGLEGPQFAARIITMSRRPGVRHDGRCLYSSSNKGSPHKTYFQPGDPMGTSEPFNESLRSQQTSRPQKSWKKRWLRFGAMWVGAWIIYACINRESVPISGRRRFTGLSGLGSMDPQAIIDFPRRAASLAEQVPDVQQVSIPQDDFKYMKVKRVLDRILPCTGLHLLPWRLVVSKLDCK